MWFVPNQRSKRKSPTVLESLSVFCVGSGAQPQAERLAMQGLLSTVSSQLATDRTGS